MRGQQGDTRLRMSLGSSRAVDRDGYPLVLYHATNRRFSSFTITSDIGYHFGDLAQATKRRSNMISRGEGATADEWRVIPALLRVENPLILPDDPGAWNPGYLTKVFNRFLNDAEKAEIKSISLALETRDRSRDWNETGEPLRASWLSEIRRCLLRNGFDGVLYRNIFESKGRLTDCSWAVLDNEQIVQLPEGDYDASFKQVRLSSEPATLNGAGPLRKHQNRGIGSLARSSDAGRFRSTVERWAADLGLDWQIDYPLNYVPSFGEGYPDYDLAFRCGEDRGYTLQVHSKRGYVMMAPFEHGVSRQDIMNGYASDASELFFCNSDDFKATEEIVSWLPGETIETFTGRLSRVHADIEAFSFSRQPARSTALSL